MSHVTEVAARFNYSVLVTAAEIVLVSLSPGLYFNVGLMKGYLPHRVVKAVVFWVLTVCIVVSTLAGILLAWGSLAEEWANRCFWTSFILAAGSLVFLTTNLAFGSLTQDMFEARRSPGPPMDPAFTETLKKAKELRSRE